MNRLVVSTECPTCGAPLDFAEGSNAVRCGHCRSNLLVTGRKQILSYSISPRLDAEGAAAKATAAPQQEGKRWRVVKRQLYFIPYYRVTGQDFIWEKAGSEAKPGNAGLMSPVSVKSLGFGEDPTDLSLDSIIEDGLGLLSKLFKGDSETDRKKQIPRATPPAQKQKSPTANLLYQARSKEPVSLFLIDNDEIEFRDRYVEKNFVASELEDLGLYSLGVRPAVLRLGLFRRAELEASGKIVSANTTPETALRQGMKMAGAENIIYRQVIGRVLSLIYFPFWVVEVEDRGQNRLTVVDAVSESVIKPDAAPSLYTLLEQKPNSEPAVIGFRPLTCPNCGWDLPVDPDNVIFFCSSCRRAWQIGGKELSQLPYEIAQRPNPRDQEPVKYLPFWVFESKLNNRSCQFHVPAFRCRRLKLLSDLAIKISRKQPLYPVSTGETPPLQGCYYDQEDAVLLAEFICAGLAPKRRGSRTAGDDNFSVTASKLTWFPFREEANYLLDPFLGLGLPQSLLA